MRKLFSIMTFVAIVAALTACTSGNTPTAVFKKAQAAAAAKDYKTLAECIYVGDGSAEEQQANREQLVGMFEEKVKQADKDEVAVNPTKVISEEIADDGQTAKIEFEETKPDGTVQAGTQKLRKDAEGNWKLDIGK